MMDIADKVITLTADIQSGDFTFLPCLETFLYTFHMFAEPYVGGRGRCVLYFRCVPDVALCGSSASSRPDCCVRLLTGPAAT